MEFVCIEAGTFMEMNEALEAIARRVHETCGGSTRGMDEWIDNQEACTLMGPAKENVATPEKRVHPLQLHRP